MLLTVIAFAMLVVELFNAFTEIRCVAFVKEIRNIKVVK